MKQCISWILVIAITLTALPMTAFAEEVSGSCGEQLTWELTAEGVLHISGKGKMEDFEEEDTPWYEYAGEITSLIVQDGVETIGTYAFAGCTKLCSATLGSSLVSIGEHAFDECSFTSITIPAGVMRLSNGLFRYCKKLVSIQVDEANPYFCSQEGVLFTKDMQTLLAYPVAKEGTSYTIPGADVADHAFFANKYLEELIVEEGTLSIGDAFRNCSALTSVSLPRSLQRVSDDAFAKSALEKVCYDGTKSMWELLDIDEENLLLSATHEFLPDNEVEPLWDALHQVLNLKGNAGDAKYALVAIYDKDGRMVRAEVCTKEELESEEGVTLEGTDLADTGAKIMYVQDEGNIQPVYEPEKPKEDKDYTTNSVYEGWLYATEDAFVDRINDSVWARTGKLLFSDGETTLTVSAEDVKLSKEDLGKAFRVEYVADSGEILHLETVDTCAYDTAEVREMESKVKYATTSNQASNKYVFTIGKLKEMPFDAAVIPVLTLTDGVDIPEQMEAAVFYNLIQNGNGNVDRYTVIDRDGDGDIDYLLHMLVGYGEITKIGTSKKYGDYLKIANHEGTFVSCKGGSNLYLEETIYTEEEPEAGDIVKYFWNAKMERLQIDKLPKTFDAACTKVLGIPEDEPSVEAKAAILYELNTDTILLEQDADEKLYPASITKLMTALVALEHDIMSDVVAVTSAAINGLYELGSASYLLNGEEITAIDLMRYLLIGSGNDAANALAIHVSGSVEAFVELMNEKAKELGMTNTHFANPHGLHHEEHYTTARDLLTLTKEAMKNEVIAQLVAEEEVVLPITNKHDRATTKYTTNHMLSKKSTDEYYYEGTIGVKTGVTAEAGQCLAAGCVINGYTYYSVVLGAEKTGGVDGRFVETIKLLDWVSETAGEKACYTLDGEDYTLADKHLKDIKETLNGTKGLGRTYDIVTDGDLLVWAACWEDIEEINEHLAVLLSTEEQVSVGKTVNNVKLLYSSGEQEWLVYDDTAAKDKNSSDVDVILTWDELKVDQLVIVHKTDDGVWLEAIPDNEPLAIDHMHEFVDEVQFLNGTLTIEGGEAELAGAPFAADAILFVKTDDNYLVCTAEELGEGTFENVELTALIRTGKLRTNPILGGFLKIDTAQYTAINDYLFVVEDSDGTSDKTYATVRTRNQKEEMDVCLDPSGVTQVNKGSFYAYETTLDGTYILSELTEVASGELTCDEDGLLYYDNNGTATLLDVSMYDVIGLQETAFNSKQNTMATTYGFYDSDEIEAFVMDYQDEFCYCFTAYETSDRGDAVLVLEMEEAIEYADATAIYADGNTIDPDAIDAVELLYELDIMKGDGKNFNPESAVTHAEMAKMIYVMLNYGKDDGATNYRGAKMFSDVMAGAWYEGYVNYCAATKLTQGKGDGTFGPMDAVSCADAAKFLLLALGYDAETRGYLPSDANWEKNVLSDAAVIGLLDGYNYNVNAAAPRQWLAKMNENALTSCYTHKTESADGVEGMILFGKKYYDLSKNSLVWKAVYGQ